MNFIFTTKYTVQLQLSDCDYPGESPHYKCESLIDDKIARVIVLMNEETGVLQTCLPLKLSYITMAVEFLTAFSYR